LVFDLRIDLNFLKCVVVFQNHEKKGFDVTFLAGEATYAYGTIGTINSKIRDFKRNLVFDSLNMRNNKNYIAYNYTGMSIIRSNLLENYKYLYKRAENFEQTFYPNIIQKLSSNLVKIEGTWYSIDNIKDLNVVDKVKIDKNKFKKVKKLKLILKKVK